MRRRSAQLLYVVGSGMVQRVTFDDWIHSSQIFIPQFVQKINPQPLKVTCRSLLQPHNYGGALFRRSLTNESSSLRKSDEHETMPQVEAQDQTQVEEIPLNANCVACVASEVKIANCWSCGTERKGAHDLFCRNCGSIQPPGQSSFFDLLGVSPPDFEIDVKKIEARYKNLMRQLHPDKYMQQCARQRDFSSVRNS